MNTLEIGCVSGLSFLEDVERNKKKLVERGDGGLILVGYVASPISAQQVAFTSLFEYSFNSTLHKGGRASTSQIHFSESNIVHKNFNAALGQSECRLHSVTSACVDNASYRVGIA